MTAPLLASLGISLALTLALEPAFFLLAGKRGGKDMMLVVMVNVLTNPAVVLIYWMMAAYTDWYAVFIVLPLEASAVLVEGHYYKKYGKAFKRPYIFSLAANAFSYGAGALLQLLIKYMGLSI